MPERERDCVHILLYLVVLRPEVVWRLSSH
jgi:hypothetical protein